MVRPHGAFLFYDFEGGWERYVPSLWSGRRSTEATKGGETKGGDAKGVEAPKPA